jgi:hypothetical protein
VRSPQSHCFGADGHLVANNREQGIIARMRQLRSEGMSFRGIASRLDGEGIPPKRGRRWDRTTVKSILKRHPSNSES